MKSSLEISRDTELRPVAELAADMGLLDDETEQHGRFRAKISLDARNRLAGRPDAKLVVVTAITPTKFGEGKTTSAISLVEGLGRLGTKVALTLREPSMGPVFGIKGGGAGGGFAQVAPMEDINLHFNGDIHAVTSAHNLLAAALDASIFHGNPLGIEPTSVLWPRALDVNDRALRNVVIGLGGKAHGVPRESRFVITAASEIMAILALALDTDDLRARMGRIVVALTFEGAPVTADDLGVAGAMTVVMKEALKPNLVQTLEGQPALIHAGPFGNIAHGNNSLVADQIAMKLADVVVTEAGFGSDLGFEKFCHITARYGNLTPSAAVIATTVRGIKSHSGQEDPMLALKDGVENLAAHIDIVRGFGLPSVVAVNRMPGDDDMETGYLRELAEENGADEVVMHSGFENGGAGAEEFAEAVLRATRSPNNFAPLYDPKASIPIQLDILARRVYGGDGVVLSDVAKRKLEWLSNHDMDQLPVCVAKTHLSLSHDPALLGRPHGFMVPVRDLQVSAGAGFVVAPTGEQQLMPGLGREPAFKRMDVDERGDTVGLF